MKKKKMKKKKKKKKKKKNKIIIPVGMRGGPDFHIFSAAREPRNF